jgi:transcriptional regulator with XRE-family HTH domain
MTFLEKIDKLRTVKRLNKAEFAASLKISESTVYAWYNRGTEPTYAIIQKIAQMYGPEWAEIDRQASSEIFTDMSGSMVAERVYNYMDKFTIKLPLEVGEESIDLVRAIVDDLMILPTTSLRTIQTMVRPLADDTRRQLGDKTASVLNYGICNNTRKVIPFKSNK